MSKSTRILIGPLFLFSPIISFLVALTNIRSKSSMFVYLAFSMLFGYAISFSDTSADSYRYALVFNDFINSSSSFNFIIQSFTEGSLRDVYRYILYYFVSLFSENPKVMYAFAGLIYGYFSYKSLMIYMKIKGQSFDKFTIILGVIFYTYISLSNVNGFRFNTGGLVLFCSVYYFFIENKNKWFLGILITPFFHYGFLLVLPILIIMKFLHNKLYNFKGIKNILILTFIFSFFLSFILSTNFINISFLTEPIGLDSAIGARLDYINSDYITDLVNKRSSNSIFLTTQKYFLITIKIYLFISVLKLNNFFNKRNIKFSKKNMKLFSFVIMFLSFCFIAESIPSGGRFMNFAYLFYVLFLLQLFNTYKILLVKKVILFSLPGFIFQILFTNVMLPVLILSPTFWYGTFFGVIIEGLNFQL
ncbi:hypothetical protein OAI39_03945 [Polaribacter sp.]|nr:hypothetical protein [Polaribacter sp.]